MWRDGQLGAREGRPIVVRRRARERDRAFLEEAHVAALGPIVLVGMGWTKERLRQQFFREVTLAHCEVISVDGRDAGYVSTVDRGAYWYIDAIAIVPRYQRKGVGGAVLRALLDDAAPRPVRLTVLRTNRARGLYARLGFVVVAQDGQRELMEWRATAP